MSLSRAIHKTTALLTALCIALSPLCHANIPYRPETSVTVDSCSMQLDQLSYDDIIYLLDSLESGQLEEVCSEADLEKINEFLAALAREGASEDDPEIALDIQELGQNEVESKACISCFSKEKKNAISAICCKSKDKKKKKKESWTIKKWRRTKRFVRNHKKEIIIGAAIVVCATVATVAIVLLVLQK
ncbi:MAG: hypothetical protein Tsb0015_13640 [Simkaniaceae bacterium]